MSTRIMAECWPLDGMSITQKAVLVSLADMANDDGFCWPSVATIAKRICGSERVVQGAIRELERLGALVRFDRRGQSTFYRVTPGDFTPQPPQDLHPRKSCTPAESAPTPADPAPPPPQNLHPTPADPAPRTVREPSFEPSRTTTSSARGGGPAPVGPVDDWVPRPETLEALVALFRMPPEFVEAELFEFRTYWRDRGGGKVSWDSAFHRRCSEQWQIKKHTWRASNATGSQPDRPASGEGRRLSAAERVARNVARERARAGSRDHPGSVDADGPAVRPPVDEQLRGRGGPGGRVGRVFEGDYTQADS